MSGSPWSEAAASCWKIVGATLVLAGVALAAVGANDLLQYETSLAAHGGVVLDLGTAAQPGAEQHGQLLRVVGKPVVIEPPRDPAFNLTIATPLLTRHVEMFQWREVNISNNVHYEMDWVDHRVDSSTFRRRQGHANPAAMPLQGREFAAGRIRIGGFFLAPTLQRALPGLAKVPPDPRALAANLAVSFAQHGDYLQTSERPGSPQLGDLRVSWTSVPLQQITLVARGDGDVLRTTVDARDGQGYQMAVGNVSLFDLFPDLPLQPRAVAFKRVLAILLAAWGAFLLVRVDRRSEGEAPGCAVCRHLLLALGAGSTAVGVVTALLWIGHDQQRMGWWLAVAVAGALLAAWQLRARRV